MVGKLADAEDYQRGNPIKIIILKADRPGEQRLFKAWQQSSDRHVRVTFDGATGECRLVLPPDVVEALKTK